MIVRLIKMTRRVTFKFVHPVIWMTLLATISIIISIMPSNTEMIMW
jgi:hypothetical protein